MSDEAKYITILTIINILLLGVLFIGVLNYDGVCPDYTENMRLLKGMDAYLQRQAQMSIDFGQFAE